MIIEDITQLLSIPTGDYDFYFNPSIINVKENIFIMSYRVIKYKPYNIEVHPWKIWWDGYKLIEKHNPITLSKDVNLKYNDKLFLYNRTRDCLSIDIFLNLEPGVHNQVDPNLIDYDSTGLAVLKYTDKWEVIYNNNNIFDYEMNQDTRIMHCNDKIYLSYNLFEKNDDKLYVKMKYRELVYNDIEGYIYLSLEKEMLDSITYNQIEKNCVFDDKNQILYKIGEYFEIIKNGTLVKKKINILTDLIKLYGAENIHLSLSTPAINYKNNYIALGHIKFEYKLDYGDTPLGEFLKKLNYDNIKSHGKFIYMMFFYEYSDNINITRISDFFIPKYEDLDYYLVFPTGLTCHNNKYYVSYGEGDCKSKILTLDVKEIELLLKDVNLISANDINFVLLDNNYFNKKKILHIGYFNEFNCGDDAFMIIFKYLNYKYYNNCQLVFKTGYEHDNDYNLVTVGGGDVINSYFIEKISKNEEAIKKLHAVSVGIPYTADFNKIDVFKTLTIRNSRDITALKNMYPDKSIEYFPDLTFLLNRFVTPIDYNFDKSKFKIGLCLTRTFYNENYKTEYMNFVLCIVKLIRFLLKKGYQIYLVPFGIHKNKIKENDIILIKHLKSFFINEEDVINVTLLDFYDRSDYVLITYSILNNLDFCVCSRYHSHIFNTILQKPFISYTSSRKCREYMKEMELSDLLIELKTNNIDLPCEFDSKKLIKFVTEKIELKDKIIERLKSIMNKIDKKMDNFVEYWKNLVYSEIN